MEDQYDDKLGFEAKMIEIKTQMKNLRNEIPEYKYRAWVDSAASPSLTYLNSNGVTNEDIIGINRLVTVFKNSEFLNNLPVQNDTNKKSNGSTNNNTLVNKKICWKLFIEKLASFRNINLEINKQLSYLKNLKIQLEKLTNKKKEMDKIHLEAVSNFNRILSQTYYSINLANQIND